MKVSQAHMEGRRFRITRSFVACSSNATLLLGRVFCRTIYTIKTPRSLSSEITKIQEAVQRSIVNIVERISPLLMSLGSQTIPSVQ